MRRLRYALRFLPLLLLGAVLFASGCDSGGDPGEDLGDGTSFSISAPDQAVASGAEYSFDVAVNDPGFQELTVDVVFDAEASTVDFSDISGIAQRTTLTFPESATSGQAQTLTFSVDDDAFAGNDRIVFTLENPQPGTVAGEGTFTLTLGVSDIETVRAAEDGNFVSAEAVITRLAGANTYVQGEAGGLVIRQPADTSAFRQALDDGDIEPGDRLLFTGVKGTFNGLEQINLTNYELLEAGAGLPDPQVVSLTDLLENGEDYESELIRINGLSFEDASGSFESGTNYTVTSDDDSTFTLRIDSASDYVGESIPDGTFDFVGPLGQFNGSGPGEDLPNDGYQLFPLADGDLTNSQDDDGDDDGDDGDNVTIAEARQAEGEVTFDGVVTRAFGDFVRLQDESGPTGASALYIRQTGGAFNQAIQDGTIEPGTRLQITGTVGEFNGNRQINEDALASYEVLGQGDVPDPQMPSLADIQMNGEDYEGELVQIDGLTFEDAGGSFSNGTSYDVTDGTTTLTFRVQSESETALGGETVPNGTFTFAGVVGEFNGSYQLIPIRPSDLEATSDDGDDDDGSGGDGSGGDGGDNDDGGDDDGSSVVTVAEARSMVDGGPVTLEAIVTSVGSDEARLQDETAGIYVSRNEDFAQGVERGDRVRVTGTVTEFANQLQIDSDNVMSFEVLSSGNDLPAVQTLSNLTELDEEYESERVRIEGVTITPDGSDDDDDDDGVFTAGGGGANYGIIDGEGNRRLLRIPSGSFYGGVEIPTGTVTIEGVSGQYSFGENNEDVGYQILVRYEGGIESDGGTMTSIQRQILSGN